MKRTLTWLHISDLHFCEPRHGWDANRVIEALNNDFRYMVAEHGLMPDLIFFTGDAAFGQLKPDGEWAIANQYRDVGALFELIRTSFTPEIQIDNFFIIPGNHDVNRSKVLSATTQMLEGLLRQSPSDALRQIQQMIQSNSNDWKVCLDRLSDYAQFLENNHYDHLLAHKEHLAYSAVRKFGEITLGLIGLNSAWSCCCEGEKGRLWLGGKWQIHTLYPEIRNADIKIGLIHHPVNWLCAAEDPSVNKDIEKHFHFLLHGHEHENWVSEINNSHARIAAGACYGDSPEESGYNFVRLDLDKPSVEVWLRRYDEFGKGWVPRIVHNRTDTNGTWRLRALDWLRLHTHDRPDERPVIALDAVQGSPESRGVYGRHKDIGRLLSLLRQKPIVTVYGISGIGKSELIKELRYSAELSHMDYVRLKVYGDARVRDVYRQLAPSLGSHENDPILPEHDGQPDLTKLSRYKGAECLIHLDLSQDLITSKNTQVRVEFFRFLSALSTHIPGLKIVLESRVVPPVEVVGSDLHSSLKLKGLEPEGVQEYFARPFKKLVDVGWHLTKDDAQTIYHLLGGKREREHAHPLAMVLLASVARGKNEFPITVLRRFPKSI